MKNLTYKIAYCIGVLMCICYSFIPSGTGVIEGEDNAFGAILRKPTALVGMENVGLFRNAPFVLSILIYWLPAILLIAAAVLIFIMKKKKVTLILTAAGSVLFIIADVMCICNEVLYIGAFLNIIGAIIALASILLCMVDQDLEYEDYDGGYSEYRDGSSTGSGDDKDQTVAVKYGEVTCLTGEFEGGTFRVEGSLTIGKDARRCNVVLSNKTVSRVHCIIRYVAATDTYTVKDMSSNGTYFDDGKRLTKDYEMQVPRKTVIYMGKPQESFVLD